MKLFCTVIWILMVNIFYAGKVAGFSIDFPSNHRYQRDGAVPLQHVQHLSVPQGQKHC